MSSASTSSQLHWWDYGVPGYVEAAVWLDELRRAGKIRHVGVTNFDQPRLSDILASGAPITSHQVQYSVLDRGLPAGVAHSARATASGLPATVPWPAGSCQSGI